MSQSKPHSRIIQVKEGIVGPAAPRIKSVKVRQAGDYPDASPIHLEMARYYSSPLLLGPPLCDELVALVQHLFDEEEGKLLRHLKSPLGKPAASIAAAEGVPAEDVAAALERLSRERGLLVASGSGEKTRYHLLPLMPGVFEMALMRTSKDRLTGWHQRFAELIEALYDTGYMVDYATHRSNSIRYVPTSQAIEGHPAALPSDRLEEILDRYDSFAVGLCQCRISQQLNGHDCGHPLENCVAFGDVTRFLIRTERMRAVSKKDVLAIKAEAESAGLATFVSEVRTSKTHSGASCSCCGCCCGALRAISEFDRPELIAPPQFVPAIDLSRCTYCAQCARACPVGAIVVDTRGKTYRHLSHRCIGCGLCAVACNQAQAIRMEATPHHRPPTDHWMVKLLEMMPAYLGNAWAAWRRRR